MGYYYLLFNQKVKSDILLPEAVKISATEDIDIRIETGRPPQWVFDKIKNGYFDHLEEKIMWFYLRDMILFYVENGNHIIIYKEAEDMKEAAVRSYLTGSAMALALIQKKYIPVHGATVEYRGAGIIISGESGAGKSTVMAELLNRGFGFVADDLSPLQFVDKELQVLPAFPQQKLCRDVAVRYGMKLSELIYIDEDRDKYARILEQGYITHPLPVACMVILSVSEAVESVECSEVSGGDKLKLLMDNIYRGFVYRRFINQPERFYMLVQAAAAIPMLLITRPKEGNSVPEIIEFLTKRVTGCVTDKVY